MTLVDHAHELFVAWAPAAWLIAFGSAVMLVASLVLIPLLLVRLPADYFERERPPVTAPRSRLRRLCVAVARNTLGIVLMLAGVLMLFLPGQGLLTIAAAVIVLDFRGKRSAERWLATRPAVLAAANRIRHWRGYPPFSPPRR